MLELLPSTNGTVESQKNTQHLDFGDALTETEWEMGIRSCLLGLLPFAAMVMIECLDVGLTTLSKAAMSRGMSNYVFVVYSHALATLILFPSSFIINRSSSPCSLLSNKASEFCFFLCFIDTKVKFFPFVFRNKRPPLTISLLCKFFLLSLAGYVIYFIRAPLDELRTGFDWFFQSKENLLPLLGFAG